MLIFLFIDKHRLILNQMFCGAGDPRKDCESREEYKKIGHYLFREADKIGQGNFSKVYKGIDRKNDRHVAIKVIKYSSLTSKISEGLLKNEVKILRELKHPNIIQCQEIFTSQSNCYIVTQFCQGGDLQRLLMKKKAIDEHSISKIIYEVYKGLLYMNEMNIIHRDFKPANIFLTKDGSPKIADFGFAVKSKEPFKDISIGSPLYMSPQGMLLNQYGPKSQVWGFGILLYEIVHGDTPLSHCKVEKQLKEKILIAPWYKENLSPDLRQCIERCLTIDPKLRISIQQLGETSYMSKIRKQFQGFCIPKELFSTSHTSTLQHFNISNLIRDLKFYDEGLAILHYCRLLHKTSLRTASPILSQWLLTLSCNLQKARPYQGNPEKIQKFIETTKDYYLSYQKEHKENNLIVQFDDIKKQSQRLIHLNQLNSFSQNLANINGSFLSMLMSETQMLQKSINCNNLMQYAKNTKIEAFLERMRESSGKNVGSKVGFSIYKMPK